jgi:hypothetical protein
MPARDRSGLGTYGARLTLYDRTPPSVAHQGSQVRNLGPLLVLNERSPSPYEVALPFHHRF